MTTWKSPDRVSEPRVPQSADSFGLFYRRNLPLLYRYLVTAAQDSSWAADLAQDAMIAACDGWDELQALDQPDRWLFKVAIRRLRRLEARARDRGWLGEDPEDSVDLAITAATDPWVSDQLEVIVALRSLPRRQGEVVGLHYLAGYPIADVSMILGIGEGTARTQLRRGLIALRREVALPLTGGCRTEAAAVTAADLGAAAATVTDMPACEVDRRLRRLREGRRARGDLAELRSLAELDCAEARAGCLPAGSQIPR